MNKTILKILSFALLIGLISACTEDFEEINSNPNQPEEVFPNLLLTSTIQEPLNEYALSAWGQGNLTAQLTAKFIFTDFDRYDWSPGSSWGLWSEFYQKLKDVNNLQEIAEENENDSYKGIALVLKSWMFQVLTDLWGDIPYNDALQGKTDANFSPSYDSQQEIYSGLLSDLEEANSLLANSKDAISGDILFDGNISKWQKLANSLRLRILIHMSEADPSRAEAGIKEIFDNPSANPVFTSNEDNAVMQYLASQPNTWPVHTYRVGSFNEYRMSLTIEDKLRGWNDPRLYEFFRPIDNADSGEVYYGVPNGLSDGSAESYNGGRSNLSRLSERFYEEPNGVDAILMTYSEVEFILAEAAQRGWINSNAEAHYNNGITAIMNYWDVDWEPTGLSSVEEYLSQASVSYDGELETIINQKWLSLFMTGYEAWTDYRRTGFPSSIVPGRENLNNDKVPNRFLYPDQEYTLNNSNVIEAVARQGADNINTSLWWDQ